MQIRIFQISPEHDKGRLRFAGLDELEKLHGNANIDSSIYEEVCGYIDNGIIPRFSGCEQGAGWFQARNLWQDGSATPTSGDIIFFDWVDDDGTQDGSPDHVGIVEKVENGRVYTIEGNSGNACQQNSYPIGYFEIFGYGTPKYETGGNTDDSESNTPAQGA